MSDPQPGAANAPKTDNNKVVGGPQQQRKPQRGKNPSVSATPATSTGGAQPSTAQASQANPRNAPKKPTPAKNSTAGEGGDGASRTSGTSQDNKKPQNQGGSNSSRGGRGGARGGANASNGSARKPSQGHASRGSVAKDVPKGSAPAPNAGSRNVSNTPGEEGALSSLQRVITDLKSISPPSQSAGSPGTTPMPIAQTSTLPINAPPFQPGASQYPPINTGDPRHRKANSLGNQSNNNSFTAPSYSSALQHFSPHLGAMNEDAENAEFEDGEIAPNQPFGGRQNSFTAPRFAALAAQQAQQQMDEPLTPGGRPQLAPGFTFGGKRKPNNIGGPMNEEDSNFQFPQSQQQQSFQPEPAGNTTHRRTGSEITGIMAEQIALQNQIEALQQQQQQLLQQQIASNQVMSSFTNPMAARNNVHRRIQSTQVPMGMGGFPGGFNAPAPIGGFNIPGPGLGMDPSGVPRGHGRRHSVNVLNKNVHTTHGSQPSQQFFGGFSGADGFEDGFTPPPGAGGHSRNTSRADNSWRINGGAGAIQANNGISADLAQAQAQLQSLQQFRAAAGGHHHKMPSFSFPNMLPNMMAANMMGLGGFNLLQQQHQQFQMQLQQQSQPQRKSLFAPYLPQASLPPLLAAGKLVVGILRVNKRNRSDAYISTEVLDADIYICGSKDRNRALEGDIVAVELLDVDEVWGTKKEKEEKKRKKEENAAYDPKGPQGRKNDKKKDDVEVEGQGLMLFDDEEVTDEIKPQFAGHVVAVVERMPGQLFSGTLGLLRPSSAATKEKQEAERREREGDKGEDESKRAPAERPKIVWFKPTDKRVPLIAIPTEQAPPDFVNNSESYADKLFVACIKRHPISSLHPFGTLVEELGPIGDVEVETSALLKDCNFPTEEFTDNVIKCLPPVPWTIPEHELTVRRDMREDRVFTIDPETAKDVDDAFSVNVNEDGTYDIGVHIADVSFFVKPNTALDRDARKRATSVYLVQRAVPMLPPTLSEQLCSLLPGEERLAFSCIFTLTEDARIIKKWFGKTIIKSSAKLAYTHAQNAIDGKPLGDVSIGGGHDASAIEKDINILQSLSTHLKARRIQGGTLKVSSFRLSFELGEDGLPNDCSQFEQKDAQSLVEEFMVLTNMSAAQQVAVLLPEQALLRRHEEPTERRLAAFAERAKRLGYEMDVSSAGALQRSFETIQDPNARRILEILSTKAMHRAKYFCAGMLDIAKYQHYALNAPLYTHFTSPIRRYADVLVHRQLEAVLSGTAAPTEPKFTMDRDSVAKVAQQCNIKRDAAKLAQEQSAHLFLCLLISDLTQKYGPVIRPAKVVNVLEAAFDVLVPEFGIEKRVHVDQMPIDNHVYDEHSHTLQIYWSERDVITWLAENSDDEHLKKVKKTAEQHAVKMEVASRSVHDESALFEEDDGEDEIIVNRTRAEEKKETSAQRLRSQANVKPEFEGLRKTSAGHRIQDIKELMTVPVIVTADLTKSPPVIKVYSVNPYADASAATTKK